MRVGHVDSATALETANVLFDIFTQANPTLEEIDHHTVQLPPLLKAWIEILGEMGYRFRPHKFGTGKWRYFVMPV